MQWNHSVALVRAVEHGAWAADRRSLEQLPSFVLTDGPCTFLC